MFKLLVNAPSGEQQISEVKETGGYFDHARVLWDERTDGPIPSVTVGGLVRSGNNLVFDQARQDEHDIAILPLVSAEVRTERDAKLSATDWTASTDVTMTAEMTTYRQALRDVPAQAGFPNTIDWPE
tara:strand:+ start:191 stop:571 length:381 start_codon:yes stop_codon:yes gene_type:complete